MTRNVVRPSGVQRAQIVMAMLALCLACQRSWAATFAGPFEIRQAVNFYIVNDEGRPFTLRMRWQDEVQSRMDRPVLVRVFDPDERLLLHHDDPGEKASGQAPWRGVEFKAPAGMPGVYQVCVVGYAGLVELSTEPQLPFGVYGPGDLTGRGDQFSETFFYVPPGLEQLQVRVDGEVNELVIFDQAGEQRLTLRGGSGGTVPVAGKTGEIWKLCARGVKHPRSGGMYHLAFPGAAPVILCPDQQTARSIHASVDVMEDGTICFHKFQARAHGLMQRFRALPAGAFMVEPPLLVRSKEAWLADPTRHQLLLQGGYGVYAAMPATLREQNLDPQSPWFGTIFIWRGEGTERGRPGTPRVDNPWTRCDRAGLGLSANYTNVLAAVYSINEPFNPLYRNEALRNRIIIAALQDLMLLREGELPTTEHSYYYGGERAVTFASATRAFGLVVRECSDDVRAVWTEGLRRYVDRQSVGNVAETVNQWSFAIRGLQQFSDGVDDLWYTKLVTRHLDWLLSRNQNGYGQMPAGYFAEADGPDATYNGPTLHNLAWVNERRAQRLAFDKGGFVNHHALPDALRDCIDLWNHTIAAEPDGTLVGASSFCHRTPGDWTALHFGAGVGMLADDCAGAAAHFGRAWMTRQRVGSEAERAVADRELQTKLNYLPFDAYTDPNIGAGTIGGAADLHFSVWEHYARQPLEGDLPVQASDRFTRNFGDEFFCVRRPGYYAFVYAGGPMSQWQSQRRPADPHRQHPRNGGGLCMFWTPGMGTSLLGKNVSAYAAHTIIAENAGATVWEDYWSVKPAFDADAGAAAITGQLINQPIAFKRAYRFLDDHIEYELTLQSTSSVTFSRMWECFPFLIDKPNPMSVALLDAQGNEIQRGLASAIRFHSPGCDEAHVIIFDRPRYCEAGVEQGIDAYDKPHKHGRVLAELPASWRAGRAFTSRCVILADLVERIPAAVQRVTEQWTSHE